MCLQWSMNRRRIIECSSQRGSVFSGGDLFEYRVSGVKSDVLMKYGSAARVDSEPKLGDPTPILAFDDGTQTGDGQLTCEQPILGVNFSVIQTTKMSWRMINGDSTPSLGGPISHRSTKICCLNEKSPAFVTDNHSVSFVRIRQGKRHPRGSQ